MWDAILGKLEELLLYIPRKMFEWLLDALAALIESIPVPDWFSYAANVVSGGTGFGYWLDQFNVVEGLGIVMAAYGIRFLIRRIPLIG